MGRWTFALVAASLIAAVAIQVVGEIGSSDTRDRVREAQLASLESEAHAAALEFSAEMDRVRGLIQATGTARIGLDQVDLTRALETKDHDRALAHLTALHRAMPVEVIVLTASGGQPRRSSSNSTVWEPIVATRADPAFGADLRTQVRGSPREIGFSVDGPPTVRPDSTPAPDRTQPWAVFQPATRGVALQIPILASDGRSRGTIGANFDTSELLQLPQGAAADTVMYVIDRNGMLIVRATPARLAGRRSGDDLSSSGAVRRMLEGTELRGDTALPLEEGPYLAVDARAPILLGSRPELDLDIGWIFVVARPARAVYADVDGTLGLLGQMRWALSIVLVGGGLALGIALDAVMRRRRDLAEALERQTAIGEVLRSISRSAFDLDTVLTTICERAVGLAGASSAFVLVRDGGDTEIVARAGTTKTPTGRRWRVDQTTLAGRAFLDGQPHHATDISQHPDLPQSGEQERIAIPFSRERVVTGVLLAANWNANSFSRRDIGTLELFADQAAIAIENVRLFNETRESLERQTALSEILQVISRSPNDLQPVFETIARDAVRYCAAEDALVQLVEGTEYRVVAHAGSLPELETEDERPDRSRRRLDAQTLSARVIREARTLQVADMASSEDYPTGAAWARSLGVKCFLIAPLLREGRAIGTIHLRRREPVPFTDRQVQLLETFAAQAVIAIENVRLFNEIQQKSAELAAASRHKSEFLANMSHELRTPLNAVIGFADVLEQQMAGPLNERQADYVHDISSSGKHLLDLVNEILDLSKIEAGRMKLEPSEFPVSDAVLSTLNFVRERAAKHGIELAADVPADLGTITADERKVRQILLNLLSNAVKFTPDGGWIGVSARREDGEVRISVRDTGIGIAPADQAKVFDEFQQVGGPSDSSREGTGLGLTLAKRFVELHGGRIWLESEVGRGTTFTLALPVAPARTGLPATA